MKKSFNTFVLIGFSIWLCVLSGPAAQAMGRTPPPVTTPPPSPPPSPLPPPVQPPQEWSGSFNVEPHNAVATVWPDDGSGPYTSTGTQHITIRFKSPTVKGWGANIRVEAPGYDTYNGRILIPVSDSELGAVVLAKSFTGRAGIVRGSGREFKDDNGAFFPLGGTLMWALKGMRDEPARVKQNLDYLKKQKFDYVRILGEVAWTGNAIDPGWPDYEDLLAKFLDYAYDECGLRTEITLLGGGMGYDPMYVARRVANVVAAGRQHKVLNFEVSNESYNRDISLEQMRAVGKFLRQTFPNNLVALSSGEGVRSYKDSGDWRKDFTDVYMQPETANLATIHMERSYGDLGWRIVRQSWDWKDFNFPVSHNEPIGPRSSVAEETDIIRLAMLRAVGILNGVHAFVLHNGAGVAGIPDPGRGRPANLWEVPGIDGIMEAVRGVDKILPPGTGTGQHWNNGWPGGPFNVDAFWGEGDDHGVNRNYTVSTPDGWVSSAGGVKDYAIYTATRHSLIEVFDVLQGKVQEVELQAGQRFTLSPVSRDSNGFGAFIIVGHYR